MSPDDAGKDVVECEVYAYLAGDADEAIRAEVKLAGSRHHEFLKRYMEAVSAPAGSFGAALFGLALTDLDENDLAMPGAPEVPRVAQAAESPASGSISILLDRVKKNDPVAKAKLWAKYFDALVLELRSPQRSGPYPGREPAPAPAVRGGQARLFAEETLDAMLNDLADGRYPDVENRDDLWAVLIEQTHLRLNRKFSCEGLDDLPAHSPSAFADELREGLVLILQRLEAGARQMVKRLLLGQPVGNDLVSANAEKNARFDFQNIANEFGLYVSGRVV